MRSVAVGFASPERSGLKLFFRLTFDGGREPCDAIPEIALDALAVNWPNPPNGRTLFS